MCRALGYMFRHHSKELMWHEVFQTLEGYEAPSLCLLKDVEAEGLYLKWAPIWADKDDSSLVHKANATSMACAQLVKYYITFKATSEERRIYRRWKTEGSSDIYIVAAFLNVL